MSDTESGLVALAIVMSIVGVVTGLLIGLLIGQQYYWNKAIKHAADVAVEDNPPDWWKKELIMAQARKEAERVGEK